MIDFADIPNGKHDWGKDVNERLNLLKNGFNNLEDEIPERYIPKTIPSAANNFPILTEQGSLEDSGISSEQVAQYPAAYTGKQAEVKTKAGDRIVFSMTGNTKINKAQPDEEVSPSNLATLTGVMHPTVVAEEAGADRLLASKPQQEAQLQADLYGLTNGIADAYDGLTGKYTKRIGKTKLNGTEDWKAYDPVNGLGRYVCRLTGSVVNNKPDNVYLCTHYPSKTGLIQWSNPTSIGIVAGPSTANDICLVAQQQTLQAFKEYLAAQAAAETPVTILFELEQPETSYLPVQFVGYENVTLVSCMDDVLDAMMIYTGQPQKVMKADLAQLSLDTIALNGLPAENYLKRQKINWLRFDSYLEGITDPNIGGWSNYYGKDNTGVVYAYLSGKNRANFAAGLVAVGTMPDGYRPYKMVVGTAWLQPAANSNDITLIPYRIGLDGKIELIIPTGVNKSAYNLSCIYPAAEQVAEANLLTTEETENGALHE